MNHEQAMTALRIAGVAVLIVSAWSVWLRRLTFQSRFDVAATVSVAMFGIGAFLDSPWPALEAASFPLTGRYYGLIVVGHFCYLVGAALIILAIYRRLLPDDEIGPFMRWIVGVAATAAVVMTVCFGMSSVPRVLTAEHLYLAAPDGWMKVYWVFHFGAATLFGVIASYGVFVLRRDPRSVMLNLGLAALMSAAVAGGVVGGMGVITNQIGALGLAAWLCTYLAFIAAAVAVAAQWRFRERALLGLPRE